MVVGGWIDGRGAAGLWARDVVQQLLLQFYLSVFEHLPVTDALAIFQLINTSFLTSRYRHYLFLF